MILKGEARFNEARKQLAFALKNLEEVTKEKVRESTLHTKLLHADDEIQTRLAEQAEVMDSLQSEVNRLQTELSDLGKETEFLRETNKTLGQRIENFRQQKNDLVKAIEADITTIHKVIEKYDS